MSRICRDLWGGIVLIGGQSSNCFLCAEKAVPPHLYITFDATQRRAVSLRQLSPRVLETRVLARH